MESFVKLQQQQQLSLSPKILGSATCVLFHHSILSEIITSITFLIGMSFFTPNNVILVYLSFFFVLSTSVNSLFLIEMTIIDITG
jgi:hypothetical protein